jgi:hypothetical protein
MAEQEKWAKWLWNSTEWSFIMGPSRSTVLEGWNMTERERATRAELDKRVDVLGWGVLFVVLGVVGLAPDLPEGAWLIAAGLVFIGVSVVRAIVRLPVSGFTTIVGVVALAAGIGSVAGLDAAVWPLVLIVLGLSLIVGVVYRAARPSADASIPVNG